MVYVNNKKFACESCIKGHRSSSCSHTDRPLFEVKKKGRPVSQCERCRELRQSRKVHSKCTCNDTKATSSPQPQKQTPSQSGTKSNRRFVPIEPALPNGLRDILKASKPSLPADARQRVDTLLNPCHCNARNASDCSCVKASQTSSSSSVSAQDEPRLITLARAAASCCSTVSPPVSNHASNVIDSSKRNASRPNTPPGTKHKRLKSDTSPAFALPPIFPSPLPLPTSIPAFAVIPPLSAVASLAGSGCACGLQCACPDCDEHHGERPITRPPTECCSKGCNHCVDPSLATSLPGVPGSSSGTSIIDKFFARAAALPSPPSARKAGGVILDPMDTTVYPSNAHETEKHSAAFGLVNLPKLECCGGNCGCLYGSCACGQACNGCCSEHDATVPAIPIQNAEISTPPPPAQSQIVRSCCSGKA